MARYRIAGLFLAVALVFLSPRSAPAGLKKVMPRTSGAITTQHFVK